MAVTWNSVLRFTLTLVLLGAFATACFTLPMEKILKSFLVWIDTKLGHWGPLVLAVAYIPLTVLAVPASILTLGGGYLYGLTVGFIADSIGSTAGATAAFIVGKTIGRSYVVSKLKDYPQFQAVAIAIQQSGFKTFYFLDRRYMTVFASRVPIFIVLLLRLVPLLPFNMLNYLLSVTPVSIGEYMLASWIGMMPITFAFVYVGTTIKDLSDVTHGWSEISTTRWIFFAGGLAASVGLMVLVTKVARRSLNKALEENNCKLDCLSVQPGLPVVHKSQLNLEQPLIIKVEPGLNNDQHQS